MKHAFFRLSIMALASLLGVAGNFSTSLAQEPGGLTVSPTRIVFEGRQRSAEVTLVNTTSTPATYRVLFKNMRMLEDGSYKDIDTTQSGELFADQLILYSPRQVYLEPGVSQIVRLLLRKPPDLPVGEYRSHLLFQALPSEAGTDVEKPDLKEGEIQIKISTVYGVTIPVIVRQGELSATVSISDLSLESPEIPSKATVLFLRLNRSGNRTVSGEVKVTFKSEKGGDEQVVGLAHGIAVLSPYLTRVVKLPLKVPEGVVLQNGRLHIVYRARPEEGGAVLAEADLRVP